MTWPEAIVHSVWVICGAFVVWRVVRGMWGHEP